MVSLQGYEVCESVSLWVFYVINLLGCEVYEPVSLCVCEACDSVRL